MYLKLHNALHKSDGHKPNSHMQSLVLLRPNRLLKYGGTLAGALIIMTMIAANNKS